MREYDILEATQQVHDANVACIMRIAQSRLDGKLTDAEIAVIQTSAKAVAEAKHAYVLATQALTERLKSNPRPPGIEAAKFCQRIR